LAGRIIIDQSCLKRYSAIWIIECGICSGVGLRGGIRTNVTRGSPINTGIPRKLGTLVFSTKKNRLKRFSDTKIVRHIGLKLDKNPYLDIEYFKLRKFRQHALKLTGWYKTSWDKLQDGVCA
jgi:hypothetical protein